MTDDKNMLISSFLPFPNVLWWAYASEFNTVCFDAHENFQKMSYRNRYYISGANGMIQLSIPLEQGRSQKTIIKDVKISNHERWQVQHWRTLVSVYKRSPYFEHYEQELYKMFEKPYNYLADFNADSIHWLKEQSGILFEEKKTGQYAKHYDGATDLRESLKPGIEKKQVNNEAHYHQVFADRTGFLPNLSLLDLLCSEGPHAKHWMKTNKTAILNWNV